jgi:hypothetical protein
MEKVELSTEKSLVCPVMSCRLINESNSPMVVKCQRDGCAWWDIEHRCCIAIGLKIEVIR